MDIPQTKLREYLKKIKKSSREEVANVICNGEAFVNAIDSPSVQILLDVLSERVNSEFRELLILIREGKYEDNEELRRIRQHCIGISKMDEIVRDWEVRLNTLERHLQEIE